MDATTGRTGHGHPCPACGGEPYLQRGGEVGNTFKLGTKYSESLGDYYQNERGDSHPIVMASYGIGVGRLIACIIENFNDEYGIQWPLSIAPYQVHLVCLASAGQTDVWDKAEALYGELSEAGLEVLYDDRQERVGVKFNDADLVGIPLQIAVGKRGLAQGQVELKLRRSGERHMLDADNVRGELEPYIQAEQAWLDDLLVLPVPD